MFIKGKRAKYGFSGSNMAFPKSILKKYKGFSTNFGRIGRKLRMGEDTEFFLRIYEKIPFFWYDPAIKVYHWTPVSKMNLEYRVTRSFKLGQSFSQLEKSRISILTCCKKCLFFFLFLFKMPYNILKSKKYGKSTQIKLIQKIAFNLGSLLAQFNLVK